MMVRYGRLLQGRFSQGVIWNIGSLAFLAGGGIVINLLVVRFRGEIALGIFNQVYAIYIVLSQLGVGGLQHSVLKHVSYHQQNRRLCADITTSALILILAITVPMVLISAQLSQMVGPTLFSPDVARGLLLALPGLIFFAMNKVLINTLNGLRYMRVYAVFRSLRFILIPATILVILYLELDNAFIAFSLTSAEFILFLVLVIFVYGQVIPLRWIDQPRARFTEHFSFGVRGILSGILLELNTRVDVVMLGLFMTDTMVGIYSFPAILVEGLAQLPLALRWNLDPLLGEAFAENKPDAISALARRVRRIFWPAMLLIGVIAVIVYPIFLTVLADAAHVQTSWLIFAILLLGVVVNAPYRAFSGLLLQGGKPGVYTLLVMVLVLSNIGLNIAFIPLLGIVGAAIATLFTFLFESLLLVMLARKILNTHL